MTDIIGFIFVFQLTIALLSLGFFVLSIGTPAGILNGVILLLLASPFVGKLVRLMAILGYIFSILTHFDKLLSAYNTQGYLPLRSFQNNALVDWSNLNFM